MEGHLPCHGLINGGEKVKKKYTLVIAGILMFLFAGCQSVSTSVSTSEETTVSQEYYAQWPDADFALSSATEAVTDGTYLYAICSGGSAIQTDFRGLRLAEWSVPLQENQSLSCLSIGEDGKPFLLRTTAEETEKQFILLALEDNGEYTETGDFSGTGFPLDMLQTGDQYIIALERNGDVSLAKYNTEMQLVAEISVPGYTSLLTHGEDIYVSAFESETQYTEKGTEVFRERTILYQLKDMSLKRVQTLDGNFDSFFTYDGTLCLSDAEGVYTLNLETMEQSKLADWENLGLGGTMESFLAALTIDNMFFLSTTLDSSAVLLLTTIAPEPDEHTITLTLGYWALLPEDEMAIQSFNRSQNDYQIELICYYPKSGDIEAAMAQMNAELLTGDPPDLYALNGMNIGAMENTGLLLDLHTLMDADSSFSAEGYYENIWELFETGGKLYEFLPDFSLAGLTGPKSVLGERIGWTLDDLEEYTEEPLVSHSSNSDFLHGCIRYGDLGLIDTEHKTCRFDSDEMLSLLSLCDKLPDERRGSGLMQESWLSSIYIWQQLREEAGEDIVCTGYPSETETGPAVNAFYAFAVSASTENQEGAWEFLKYLLRDNQQEIYAWSYFPVKKAVLEAQLEKAQLPTTDQNSPFYGSDSEPLTEADAVYLQSLIGSASRRAMPYTDILDIVVEESEPYFSGDKTAEAVADIIQNRVSIYLAEQG